MHKTHLFLNNIDNKKPITIDFRLFLLYNEFVKVFLCFKELVMFFKKKKVNTTEQGRIVVTESGYYCADYNRLKDNILFMNADGNMKVIQIESSLSHECKTTVACNLAVSLGFTEKKVIVVDLDFRRPRVHRAFGISKDTGIAEYMLGTATKEQVIKKEVCKNVDVMTRGGDIHNSSLVLVSEKFKNLIEELKAEYDYVILDCAPVLLVSDYIHVSKVSDSVLFLVAYGQTTKTQVADAIKELRTNNVKILGTVFTMYDRKKDKNYGLYYYKNRYYKYYDAYANAYLDKPEEEQEYEKEIAKKS